MVTFLAAVSVGDFIEKSTAAVGSVGAVFLALVMNADTLSCLHERKWALALVVAHCPSAAALAD